MNWKFWSWPGQIRALKALLKKANEDFVEELEENIKLRAVIRNDCETEELVKQKAMKHLPPLKVVGDEWGVPTEADIVDSLCELIEQQRKEIERHKLSISMRRNVHH